MTQVPEEQAWFVGGPMDGRGVVTDQELPVLPVELVADGGDWPVGYRLLRGAPGEVWRYVVDRRVADAYMEELWGVVGARAYKRVLSETGDTARAWRAAREAKDVEGA